MSHKLRERMDARDIDNKNRRTDNIRDSFPECKSWTNERILQFYDSCVSIHQSEKSRGGTSFEQDFEEYLTENNIPFERQVAIDKFGIIVPGSGTKKTMSLKGCKLVDIVFGKSAVGDSITNFGVASLKKSSRERAILDDWTKTIQPAFFLYVTGSDDYPHPEKFEESSTRKIITDRPKAKDTRTYKLGFEDVIATILAAL